MRNLNGFSLVDNLLALVVFILGVIGLLTLQQTLQTGSEFAGDDANAQNITSAQIEKIRVLASRKQTPTTCTADLKDICDGLTTDTTLPKEDCSFSQSMGSTTFNVYTKITELTDDLKNVEVKCCWKKKKRIHQISLTASINEGLYNFAVEDKEDDE